MDEKAYPSPTRRFFIWFTRIFEKVYRNQHLQNIFEIFVSHLIDKLTCEHLIYIGEISPIKTDFSIHGFKT